MWLSRDSIRYLIVVCSAQAFGLIAFAQGIPHVATLDVGKSQALGAVAGCPNQGGILDSVSVPVNQPLDLRVVVSAPAPAGGAVFQLSSDNPAIVAAGDPRQAFLPRVTIPAGQTLSNPFRIFGISVGRTLLRITPLTSGYIPSAFPLGAWEVNRGGTYRFVDANHPARPCRDAGAPNISTSPSVLATCGVAAKGVATDGVNPMLLRTVAGLPGTACFEVVSASSLDQGQVQTPLTTSQAVSGLEYAFSLFTPPRFYGDATASRSVELEFTYTPSIGNGNTSRLRATTTIVRPPVMLLHGVWSNGNSWNSDFNLNDELRTTIAGDYQGTNGASFATNAPQVRGFIDQALQSIRNKGYGATQVDVVAHSMGGLLTRLHAGNQQYRRPENLGQGDVHRLVTLNTPHLGSNFANLLVALHRVRTTETETTVQGITGGLVTQGGVCDLAENSPALAGLNGGTALQAQVVTSTGGPAGTPTAPARYWGGVLGLRSFESALTRTRCVQRNLIGVCVQREPVFPQDIVDAFRFRELNDAVVPLSSQQGGVGGINFPNLIHFHVPAFGGGITDDAAVATRVFQVLEGPDSGLVGSLPGVQSMGTGAARTVPGRGAAQDQQDHTDRCGQGGPMKLNSTRSVKGPDRSERMAIADSRLRIVAPAAGARFAPGDIVNLTVELTPPLAANDISVVVAGWTRLEGTNYAGNTYQASFLIPNFFAGPLRFVPEITDLNNVPVVGPELVVSVQPGPPIAIALLESTLVVTPPLPARRQLYLNGEFADGISRDLTSAAAGTTYVSNNPTVLSVSPDGLCQLAVPGTAVVTVQNGGQTTFAAFLVENPSNPLAPENLTAGVVVQRSGFRLDRTTGFFVQDLTLANVSGVPLMGPLYLVVSGLPSGVSLVNREGTTETISPAGSAFFRVPLSGSGLFMPPGANVPLQLRFLNPNRVNIDYTLSVFRYSAVP